jgi:HK97 family phage major capsid protein
MKETRAILDAREELEEALRLMDEADTKIQSLPADVSEEERDFHKNTFARAEKSVAEARERLERAIAIQKAREAVPPMSDEEPTESEKRAGFKRISVGDEEPTYRKDKDGATTFVRDLFFSMRGDTHAAERLGRHQMETRDVSTADPGAGVFVPPVYLANEWAELPRETRPFANALPNRPLPATGMSFTIPRLTTGASVAVQQTEADAPSETDGDGTLLTVNVRTIAGQQDLSMQAFERTDPGFGDVILSDLRAAYDSYLDSQLLSGTGSNAQLPGIRGVTGRNTVTYTDATPTNGELLGKIYDAIQQIADGRKANPDLIVMHPRRAAWMAAGLSSSFPLFQQGQLMQAAGVQDGGFLQSLAGLRVVIDSNVGTTYGAGTNEDEVYVVRSSDLAVYESPLRVRVLPEVLSGTLQVKVQVFAYAAFASGKQPEAIGHISGTGLAAPSF